MPHVVARALVRAPDRRSAEEQLSHGGQRSDGPRYGLRHVVHAGSRAAAFDFYDRLEADNSKAFWQAEQGDVRLRRASADRRAGRRARRCRAVPRLPALQRRAVRQGSTAVQDAPGRLLRVGGRGRPLPAHRGRRDAGRRRVLLDGQGPAGAFPGRRGLRRHGAAGRAPRRLAREAGLLDRRDGRAEVGAARLSEGPSADRAPAAQGPHGVEAVPGVVVDARQAGGRKIRATWAAAAPLCSWLDAHVGPSTLPPDENRF